MIRYTWIPSWREVKSWFAVIFHSFTDPSEQAIAKRLPSGCTSI